MLTSCKVGRLSLAGQTAPALPHLSRFTPLRRRQPVTSALPGFSVIADVIFQTAPTNAAATQNAVQNMVAGTPEAVKELPEKFIIAASLTAVALLGYLLRDKFRKGT